MHSKLPSYLSRFYHYIIFEKGFQEPLPEGHGKIYKKVDKKCRIIIGCILDKPCKEEDNKTNREILQDFICDYAIYGGRNHGN